MKKLLMAAVLAAGQPVVAAELTLDDCLLAARMSEGLAKARDRGVTEAAARSVAVESMKSTFLMTDESKRASKQKVAFIALTYLEVVYHPDAAGRSPDQIYTDVLTTCVTEK